MLAVGYGGGDAAEAIPTTVAENWREAAAKIGFVIQSIGSSANPKFGDEGIEYYRFVR